MDGRNWGSRSATDLKHQKLMRVHTLGERKLIKTYRKMEPIAIIHCEFKKPHKISICGKHKVAMSLGANEMSAAKRLSHANLCQQLR